MIEALKRRVEAIEWRRPDRLVVARVIRGKPTARIGEREGPVAELDAVLVGARARGYDSLVIERVIVDPPQRPEALHSPTRPVALDSADHNQCAKIGASKRRAWGQMCEPARGAFGKA
jgi:hypothetical protein